MNVVHRLRSVLARVVQLQDRLELGPRLGKRPEVHGRDPGQAVAGKANHRIRQAFGYLPSLIGQSPHHAMVAPREAIDELAAKRRDKRLLLAETLAENA